MADMDVKQFVYRKGTAKGIPVSGTFELTSRCNFKCKMCYIQMSPEEQSVIGRELTTQQWLQVAQEAVKSGMIYLLLTGGEPLLRPDFVELYTKLVQMGIMVSVNTNGSLITEEIVECFRQYPPEVVNITLYGASSCQYKAICQNASGYEAAIRGIHMMKEAGVRMRLNTTFTRENCADMGALIDFAKAENIPIRTAAFLFPGNRNGNDDQSGNLSPEEMGKLGAEFDYLTMDDAQNARRRKQLQDCLNDTAVKEKKPERKPAGCMAGRGSFWISWDGMMYTCGMLSDDAVNILDHDFADAWQQTRENAGKLMLPAECSVCEYQKICPSCAAVSQSVHQTQGVLVPEMCQRTKAYVQTFLSLTDRSI